LEENLRHILYDSPYKADPGSSNHKEQTRRIEAAIEAMEKEMRKREREAVREQTFREKAVKKGGNGKKDKSE
tara:strand:- start:779 stop:994 length:216 start_codon:yes stop_codon:yes gene_type:complete